MECVAGWREHRGIVGGKDGGDPLFRGQGIGRHVAERKCSVLILILAKEGAGS